MKDDQYFRAESKRRQLAELEREREEQEREAARQRHLEEMRRKPNCGLPKGQR